MGVLLAATAVCIVPQLTYTHRALKHSQASPAVGNLPLLLHAQGYEYLGFTRKDGKTIYREWAPGAKAAALIGDFNGWEPFWMNRDEWGVWSIELPDSEWAKSLSVQRFAASKPQVFAFGCLVCNYSVCGSTA